MLWLLGDTHGQFKHIQAALNSAKQAGQLPAALIFLGDIESPVPFSELAASWENLGPQVWFIHGNHDVDHSSLCANLLDDERMAERNLHGRVAEIAGLRVAGLGGVFDSPIWRPDATDREPKWLSYDDYAEHEAAILRYAPHGEEILRGRLLKARGSIFYETYADLHGQSADVLITHEAAACHPHGYEEIDSLARSLGVKSHFHGHHHERPDYSAAWPSLGFRSYAVGYCGITDDQGEIIRAGTYD